MRKHGLFGVAKFDVSYGCENERLSGSEGVSNLGGVKSLRLAKVGMADRWMDSER